MQNLHTRKIYQVRAICNENESASDKTLEDVRLPLVEQSCFYDYSWRADHCRIFAHVYIQVKKIYRKRFIF